MGNLCGKQSADDNFHGEGRTLGSAPPPRTNASIPAHVTSASKPQPKVGGPARTVGGGSGGDDPRAAAAAAAEARANKPVTGDLAKKLEGQKKQTMNQTLQEAASENRAQREADAANEVRSYN
ncbi:hypothetical protein P280DRAFT_472554 [Massarina eburnea CBS 473.64]|uniref:Uncharacterized protein n=1 Tax=Massarina eburnea CBS 473.64 TaxID=1395130 RepID=A0A6A6RP01_9PLEO|nr:hypothetical protein P280DRAFT_472554 [Massarina eburnea CBS 473.64]